MRSPVRSEYEDDDIVEIIASPSVSPGGDSALAGVLLQMTGELAQLNVLLNEADEDDWRALRPRLTAFFKAVSALPNAPKAKRRIGFRRPGKK